MVKNSKDIQDKNLKSKTSSKKKLIIISAIFFLVAVIIGIIFFVIGIGPKWKKQIAFSDLKFDNDYIVGKIQNKTDKHLNVTITFELKNGSIKDTDFCYVNIEADTIDDLECLAYGKDSSYKIKVVDVRIEEIKNKSFKDGEELSIDEVKDYFKDIYNKHLEIFGLTFNIYEKDFDEELKYPYIDYVKYYAKGADSEIYINNPIMYKGDLISVTETYDVNSSDLDRIHITSSSSQESKDFLAKCLAFGYFHEDMDPGKYERAKKLVSESTADGKCYLFGDLCFSSTVNDDIVMINGYSDFE